MTETTTEGVLTQPGADVGELGMQAQPGTPETDADPSRPELVPGDAARYYATGPSSGSSDPLNAAIAATAGEPAAGLRLGPSKVVPSDSEVAAAMESYISAGVEKAMAPAGGSEIVTVGHLRAAIESLLRHLHLDHPENYLPKG